MTAQSSLVEVALESDLKNVEVAEEISRRMACTAGFDETDQHRIEMAVHESMINAIWHGNKNDASKTVWLRFQIFPDRLEIRVRDQGERLRREPSPESFSRRKPAEGFRPGNLPDPHFHG